MLGAAAGNYDSTSNTAQSRHVKTERPDHETPEHVALNTEHVDLLGEAP